MLLTCTPLALWSLGWGGGGRLGAAGGQGMLLLMGDPTPARAAGCSPSERRPEHPLPSITPAKHHHPALSITPAEPSASSAS